MLDDAVLLQELLAFSREQATMGARLDAIEGRMVEMVDTITLIRQDSHKLATDMAALTGRLQDYYNRSANTPLAVTVTATAETSRHSGGPMSDIHIGGDNHGDVAGHDNRKNPTKLLILAVIVLAAVAGGIAGVKALLDWNSVQVEPTPVKRPI